MMLTDASGAVLAQADLEVRSRKLSYKADYQQMLEDITAHGVDLLQELKAPSLFNAQPDPGHEPATLAQRFAFVRGLLQSTGFDNALHRITTHPHQIWQHEAHERSINKGFKPSGKVLRQLAQGSRRVAVPDTHPLHTTLTTLPEFITITRATPTQDTPENRFVKFALREFHGFLDTMLSRVVDKTKDARLVQEITAASQEQSSGVTQINSAMSQLSNLTQQNASSSEQLAATASEMSEQARHLQSAMSFFRVDGAAKSTATMWGSEKPKTATKKAPLTRTAAETSWARTGTDAVGGLDRDFVRF